MSDETTLQQSEPAIDPVAAARQKMAAQETAGGEVARLAKQVKVLWVLVIVSLVLSIVAGGFSIFGRAIGIGRPNFGNGNFQPGQMRQFNGTTQDGTTQGGTTTQP